jgi:hypothetical protein
MCFSGMKYEFSTSFGREQTFSIKLKVTPLGFEVKPDIFQNLKKLCITH